MMQHTESGMNQPLQGVRVLELGMWVAAPAAGTLLADWGASVIKIEPPGGDPLRGITQPGMPEGSNPWFQMVNRGKRSIAIDLRRSAGRELFDRLLSESDVLIVNLQSSAAQKLGVDAETVRAAHPSLLYCRITGYGAYGPDADRPSFDSGAFWARSGFMTSMMRPGADPPVPPSGVGDMSTALACAGAIAAALFRRASTNEGALIDVSLYRTGIHVMAWNIAGQLRGIPVFRHPQRDQVLNALYNVYRATDGLDFYLTMNTPDPYWPGLCRAIGRDELIEDPRYDVFANRMRNASGLVGLLDEVFATRTRAEWGARFDVQGVIWAEAQTVEEVVHDTQAALNNAWIAIDDPAHGNIRMPAGPADFDGVNSCVHTPAPEHGADTEMLLLELGYDWEQIAELKRDGTIP